MAYIGNSYKPKIVPDEVIDTKVNRDGGELTGDLNAGNNAINNISSVTGENDEIDFSGNAIKGLKSLNGGPLSGFRNKIINGNFDIWQRATSQTSSGYGSDDRWQNTFLNGAMTHSQQTFTIGQTDVAGNPKCYSRTVYTHASGASDYCIKRQHIENVETLSGKTATLTFWAKADSAKDIIIELTQTFGSGGSPSSEVRLSPETFSLTTSWQKFTRTISMPSLSGKTIGTNGDDKIRLLIWYSAGTDYDVFTGGLGNQSGTYDIARVSLVEGDATLEDDPFEPRPLPIEKHLCQRYTCEVGFTLNNLAAPYDNQLSFPNEMRANPSITLIGGTEGGGLIGLSALTPKLGFRQVSAASSHVDAVYRFDAEL